MTAEREPPIAMVSEHVPSRARPMNEEMQPEGLRKLSLQAPSTPSTPVATGRWAEWLAMSSRRKFLISIAVWSVSILFTFFIVWIDFVGPKGGAFVFIALLGWPIPLFYLTKWLWQELRNK